VSASRVAFLRGSQMCPVVYEKLDECQRQQRDCSGLFQRVVQCGAMASALLYKEEQAEDARLAAASVAANNR